MTTTYQTGAAALALGSVALEGIAWALRTVLVPSLALLLTLMSYWRPWSPQGASEPPEATITPPSPPEPVREPLEGLTVAQLRKIARQEGMARLGCRGRRAELLEALA